MINFYNAFTHLIVSNGLTNVGVRVGQVALHEEIFMSLTVILPRTDSSSLALLSSARWNFQMSSRDDFCLKIMEVGR